MRIRFSMLATLVAVRLLSSAAPCSAQQNAKEISADPKEAALLVDFQIQGEYLGSNQDGEKLGCQVIALGKGAFQAVVLPGGLPGAGWDGKNKILLHGKLEGSKALFTPATGKRKYLAESPDDFSATAKFPPVGHHKEYIAEISNDTFNGKNQAGEPFGLKKIERKSPTLGARPPEDAIVLFDGTDTSEWTRGRLDKDKGTLNTDGSDILTKRKFNNYMMHIEFMLPYRPEARGQGRGNSGVYQVDHYEVQVLDSFGLEGKNNECGGVYTKADPKVNMCLPPLVWQTYDVEFANAVVENGKTIKLAQLTLKHNGVVIHEMLEINGPTGGSRSEPVGTPGPIKLQGHGNPLQYRNIWIVERK